MFLLKIYFQKNDLNTKEVIFYYIIGCSIGVYNFMLSKSSIEKLYFSNIPN